jgi:hypothetical protein
VEGCCRVLGGVSGCWLGKWRKTYSYEEIAEIGEDVGCLEGLWWIGGRHVE